MRHRQHTLKWRGCHLPISQAHADKHGCVRISCTHGRIHMYKFCRHPEDTPEGDTRNIAQLLVEQVGEYHQIRAIIKFNSARGTTPHTAIRKKSHLGECTLKTSLYCIRYSFSSTHTQATMCVRRCSHTTLISTRLQRHIHK